MLLFSESYECIKARNTSGVGVDAPSTTQALPDSNRTEKEPKKYRIDLRHGFGLKTGKG
jgi:hypothetical protein